MVGSFKFMLLCSVQAVSSIVWWSRLFLVPTRSLVLLSILTARMFWYAYSLSYENASPWAVAISRCVVVNFFNQRYVSLFLNDSQ